MASGLPGLLHLFDLMHHSWSFAKLNTMAIFFAICYGKKLPSELLPKQKQWALAFQVLPIWWTQCINPGHLPSLVSSSLFFSSLAPKQVVKKTKRSQHFSFLELSWKWCLFDTLVPTEKLYIQSTLNTDPTLQHLQCVVAAVKY